MRTWAFGVMSYYMFHGRPCNLCNGLIKLFCVWVIENWSIVQYSTVVSGTVSGTQGIPACPRHDSLAAPSRVSIELWAGCSCLEYLLVPVGKLYPRKFGSYSSRKGYSYPALKGTRSNDAGWPDNADNIQIFPPAGLIWLFCQ